MIRSNNINSSGTPSSYKKKFAVLLLVSVSLYFIVFGIIFLWTSNIEIKSAIIELFSSPNPDDASNKEIPYNAALNEDAVTQNDPLLVDDMVTQPLTSLKTSRAQHQDPFVTVTKAPKVAGISFLAKLAPVKCWDSKGFEYIGAECDSLSDFALIAETNAKEILQCKDNVTTTDNVGQLTLYAEADFAREVWSVWPGTASTLRAADQIVDCIAEAWRSLPFSSATHRFSRYRLKGTVRFETEKSIEAPKTVTITQADTARLQKAADDAEEVTVTRDRVRVRKSPIDGEIIGFISTGQKIKLIEVTDDWCLVKTKRGNIGWMICWGLDIDKDKTTKPDNSSNNNEVIP